MLPEAKEKSSDKILQHEYEYVTEIAVVTRIRYAHSQDSELQSAPVPVCHLL